MAPPRREYVLPERESSVLSSPSSHDSPSSSEQRPRVHVFGGRRSTAGSGESSGATSPRSLDSSHAPMFMSSPRGRGMARVSPAATMRGRTLMRGVSSPSSAGSTRLAAFTPRGGGSAHLTPRRGGRLRPLPGGTRGGGHIDSAAARTTAAARPIYGQRALGRGRARGGPRRGGGVRGAGSDSDGQLAAPVAIGVHLLNHQARPSLSGYTQPPATVQRPVSPDSDEFDILDDDSWQR